MNQPRAREPHTDAAWLTSALREQAGEHEADLSRIEATFGRLTADEPRRTAHPRRGSRLRLRLIGVPLGVLATVATATVAVGVSLGITARTTHPSNQAVPPTGPQPTASGHQPTQSTTPSALYPAGTTSARSESSPSAPATATGPLRATGSVDSHSTQYWAQENLTVTTTRAVRALHVVVTVSGGPAVQSTGWWSTILAANLTTTVNQVPTGLSYDITVKPGQILQPGSYAFGLQFDRPATGHEFSLDAYTITATTADNAAQISATGSFSG